MPNRRVVSLVQLEALLERLEQNIEIAQINITSNACKNAQQTLMQFWEATAPILNEMDESCTKTPNEWKAYWNELKYKSRKKALALCKMKPGEEKTTRALNEYEAKALQLIGELSYTQDKTLCLKPRTKQNTATGASPRVNSDMGWGGTASRVSVAQIVILLEYMEKNPDFANSYNVGSQAQFAKVWEKLADLLNHPELGTSKSAEQWRKYWTERKYALRSKIAKRIKQSSYTGEGEKPPIRVKLSPIEARIYKIIRNMANAKRKRPVIAGYQDTRSSLENESRERISDPEVRLLTETERHNIEIVDTGKEALNINPNAAEEESTEMPGNHYSSDSEASEPEKPHRRIRGVLRRGGKVRPPVVKVGPLSDLEESDTEETQENTNGTTHLNDVFDIMWAKKIEHRKMAVQERVAASLERITAAVVGVQSSLNNIMLEIRDIKMELKKPRYVVPRSDGTS